VSNLKSIPWWIWLIPSILSFMAMARMPYGFYTLTRIVVCGTAAWFAIVGWKDSQVSCLWATAFLLIALLYNPIVPIHLKRSTWFYLDILTATAFIAHFGIMRLRRNVTA
jgi:hypothetical protein